MPETSIARARRLAREKREAEEAAIAQAKAEAAAAAEAEAEAESEGGFFSSFFGRDDAIEAAVEGTTPNKDNQSTDSNN